MMLAIVIAAVFALAIVGLLILDLGRAHLARRARRATHVPRMIVWSER